MKGYPHLAQINPEPTEPRFDTLYFSFFLDTHQSFMIAKTPKKKKKSIQFVTSDFLSFSNYSKL